MKSCIVIGAGISGLTCAKLLKEKGFKVILIDKARGVGGRMATRRTKSSIDKTIEAIFDHGAQFITVRDPKFKELIDICTSGGTLREWCRGFPSADNSTEPDGHPRFVGSTGMTAVPKLLAENLEVILDQRVNKIDKVGTHWEVSTENGDLYKTDLLVLTAPVPQSLHMIDNGNFKLDEQIRKELEDITYYPCIAVLVELNGPSAVPSPGGVNIDDPVISWIADNKQKGISPEAVTLTIHTTPEFTLENWETDDKKIAGIVIQRVSEYLGSEVNKVQVHRWRYSLPVKATEDNYLLANQEPPLLFIGDAFGGGRVEGAFISGTQGAEAILNLYE